MTGNGINLFYLFGFMMLAFIAGGFMTLGAVALGGFLVFKTKKEPHESLFGLNKPTADAFVMDPLSDNSTEENVDVVPEILKKQTERFMEQVRQKQTEKTN